MLYGYRQHPLSPLLAHHHNKAKAYKHMSRTSIDKQQDVRRIFRPMMMGDGGFFCGVPQETRRVCLGCYLPLAAAAAADSGFTLFQNTMSLSCHAVNGYNILSPFQKQDVDGPLGTCCPVGHTPT